RDDGRCSMRMKRAGWMACAAAALAMCVLGCARRKKRWRPSKPWKVYQVKVLEGFDTPESVCIDPTTGIGYVSNVVCPKGATEKVNAKDGKGFISRLTPGGRIDKLRWVDSTEAAPLHAVKGLCILDGVLYGADIDRVVRYEVKTGRPLAPIRISGAKLLNDMATDGRDVYVSDTGGGQIYRIRGDRAEVFQELERANGLAFHRGRMFALSVGLHEMYELDPAGKTPPQPFGLARHFKGIDGIAVLADGSFLVTDVWGSKFFWVGADRRTVHLLGPLASPADLAIDRRRGLALVPLFWEGKVVVYGLDRPR
ncbi:hypothetical protein ACFL09_05785, partial [Planctomycetota bacterium]